MKPKREIKNQKDIQEFLKACGFTYYAPMSRCCEFIKEIKGDDLYVYQINGEELSEITSADELVIFSENGKDPSITPMYRYSKEYPNFRSMIEEESKRGIDFSGGQMIFRQ